MKHAMQMKSNDKRKSNNSPKKNLSKASKIKRKLNTGDLKIHRKTLCTCNCGCPACETDSYKFQTKLRISHPEDLYEKEANEISEKVINDNFLNNPKYNREVNTFNETIHTKKENINNLKSTPKFGSSLNFLHEEGVSFPNSLQNFYRKRLNYNFSTVKIHTDSTAAVAANSLNARAFTKGNHVIFGTGQYTPNTEKGKKLIAHELVHVMQQSPNFNSPQIIQRVKKENDDNQKDDSIAEDKYTYWLRDPEKVEKGKEKFYVEKRIYSLQKLHFRFAYPKSALEMRRYNERIEKAKNRINLAIEEIDFDLNNIAETTTTLSQFRKEERIRARLKEAFRLITKNAPLNIYISYETSEIAEGARTIPETRKIYVKDTEVGDTSKLKAVIRLSIFKLLGLMDVFKRHSEWSDPELQQIMLHEMLHAMLIRKNADSDTIWKQIKSDLKITGPKNARIQLMDLIHKFLISQEEIFVYKNVSKIYESEDKLLKDYLKFFNITKPLLSRLTKGGKLKNKPIKLPVEEKVAKKKVRWQIEYKYPDVIQIGNQDIKSIEEASAKCPLTILEFLMEMGLIR